MKEIKKITDVQAEVIGNTAIEMLGLTLKDGTVKTSWGKKTPIGLGRALARTVFESTDTQ